MLAVLSLLFAFGTPLYAILYYGLAGIQPTPLGIPLGVPLHAGDGRVGGVRAGLASGAAEQGVVASASLGLAVGVPPAA